MLRSISALTLLTVAGFTAPVCASTFAAWQVTGVSWGDVLNIRAYPSSGSARQAAYPNGTVLQMTGRCTEGVNLFDLANKPVPVQRAAVRYRWCEIWHDPAGNGNFVTGWVYGRYIEPY